MTDKQIIIDVCPYQGECSVSGCKRNDDGCFVRQLFEERDRAENRIVELNKTIKAKEQECEELKAKCKKYGEINEQETKDYAELKAENDELKEQLKEMNEVIRTETTRCSLVNILTTELDQLKAENEELKKQLAELISQSALLPKFFGLSAEEITQLTTKCSKLSKTLTEIKEIAENCCINQATLDCENYDDCTQCGRISDGEGIQQILQKISEVEEC